MREITYERITGETEIHVAINLDGTGEYSIKTGIPFLDHMLHAFSKHSGIDITLNAQGDLEIDYHHTIEDVGIALGETFSQVLGNKVGIERFGEATVPLDEALTRVVIDFSGRSYLYFGLDFTQPHDGNGVYPYLFEEFFRGFVNGGKLTCHIDSIRGNNSHHILESAFKALGKAVKKATTITSDKIPSTKGVL